VSSLLFDSFRRKNLAAAVDGELRRQWSRSALRCGQADVRRLGGDVRHGSMSSHVDDHVCTAEHALSQLIDGVYADLVKPGLESGRPVGHPEARRRTIVGIGADGQH
jgi:hypothetical protein